MGRGHDLESLLDQLKPFAEKASQSMCCPFYLVGSSLERDDPRDIDVYGRMSDEDFEVHFGLVNEWERQGREGDWGIARNSWSRLCVVLTQWGWDVTGFNLDVQVKPASNFDRHIEKRILIGGRCEDTSL